MGLDFNAVRFLLHAREAGISFGRTATIGRQSLHLRPWSLYHLAKRHRLEWTSACVKALLRTGYAEELLGRLGAKSTDSFDFSDYESATVVHDFNNPIPDRYHNSYDAVIDGGSIEHIFNVPQALENAMTMVKTGGYFIGTTPANNQFGHGFYQFSAELYYRVFGPQNGFDETRVYIAESRMDAPFFLVSDPAKARKRVMLVNTRPVMMYVMSRRVEARKGIVRWPQQSDYVPQWESGERTRHPPARSNQAGGKDWLLAVPFSVLKGIDILRHGLRGLGRPQRTAGAFTRSDI